MATRFQALCRRCTRKWRFLNRCNFYVWMRAYLSLSFRVGLYNRYNLFYCEIHVNHIPVFHCTGSQVISPFAIRVHRFSNQALMGRLVGNETPLSSRYLDEFTEQDLKHPIESKWKWTRVQTRKSDSWVCRRLKGKRDCKRTVNLGGRETFIYFFQAGVKMPLSKVLKPRNLEEAVSREL